MKEWVAPLSSERILSITISRLAYSWCFCNRRGKLYFRRVRADWNQADLQDSHAHLDSQPLFLSVSHVAAGLL